MAGVEFVLGSVGSTVRGEGFLHYQICIQLSSYDIFSVLYLHTRWILESVYVHEISLNKSFKPLVIHTNKKRKECGAEVLGSTQRLPTSSKRDFQTPDSTRESSFYNF